MKNLRPIFEELQQQTFLATRLFDFIEQQEHEGNDVGKALMEWEYRDDIEEVLYFTSSLNIMQNYDNPYELERALNWLEIVQNAIDEQ